MSVLLNKEITGLKKKILQMTAMVEESVRKSVNAVRHKDEALADEVIRTDDEIDLMENALEEECLKILALHQPVAADLRYVVACLKINNDLERIGDLAVNIAQRAKAISSEKDDFIPGSISEMIEKAISMLKKSLDAFIETDAALAREVSSLDDEIDALNRNMYQEVRNMIMQDPKRTGYLLHVLGVSRQLERIGDYACNISEDVIYMIEGRIVRHDKLSGKG
ncbi:MAG TPA: phosphate transport system regulatory protein PhoU [Lentisphaeria bacterium]|nr:MAG: phosphate transport system regulatory protein PhoU [Lentisphaerae bacterium GWF2_49_21]HBC87995.1 phosphate transport system regulatory protein PhoU [Lentisphaeria bacterium]